jgi:hypothetical protein
MSYTRTFPNQPVPFLRTHPEWSMWGDEPAQIGESLSLRLNGGVNVQPQRRGGSVCICLRICAVKPPTIRCACFCTPIAAMLRGRNVNILLRAPEWMSSSWPSSSASPLLSTLASWPLAPFEWVEDDRSISDVADEEVCRARGDGSNSRGASWTVLPTSLRAGCALVKSSVGVCPNSWIWASSEHFSTGSVTFSKSTEPSYDK